MSNLVANSTVKFLPYFHLLGHCVKRNRTHFVNFKYVTTSAAPDVVQWRMPDPTLVQIRQVTL